MKDNILVRDCLDSDREELSLFLKSIFNEKGWVATPDDHLDDPKEYFEEHKGVLLILENNKVIIGSSVLIPLNKDECLLKRFYLAKDYRGKGLADKLLEYTLKIAKRDGYKKVLLDVSKDNDRAIHFYEKNNFKSFQTKPYDIWYESTQPENFYYYEKNL